MFSKTGGEQPHRSAMSAGDRSSKPARSGDARPACIGPSISLSGNLTGNEDLIIEGSVEGEILVRDHRVTISETGTVKADIYGRSICVEGQVEGNLVGDEQVVIRRSGRVRGNVTAPRVNLENGAKFKGSIDMQPAQSGPETSRRESPESAAKTAAVAAGTRDPKKSTAAASAASTRSA